MGENNRVTAPDDSLLQSRLNKSETLNNLSSLLSHLSTGRRDELSLSSVGVLACSGISQAKHIGSSTILIVMHSLSVRVSTKFLKTSVR